MLIRMLFLSAVVLNAQNYEKGIILKVKPLSIVNNNISAGLEVALSNDLSIHTRAGYVGFECSSTGYYAAIGPRYYLKKPNRQLTTIFKSSFFIQPEVAYSALRKNYITHGLPGQSSEYDDSSLAFLLNLGYKQAIGDYLTLEFSTGMGAGSKKGRIYYVRQYFSHFYTELNSQLVYDISLSIGLNLGTKNKYKSKSEKT